jgi:hypothetical protein
MLEQYTSQHDRGHHLSLPARATNKNLCVIFVYYDVTLKWFVARHIIASVLVNSFARIIFEGTYVIELFAVTKEVRP